jgi:hypothetical protein
VRSDKIMSVIVAVSQMFLSAGRSWNTVLRVNQSTPSNAACWQGSRLGPVTTDTILALNAAATTIEADGISFI